MLKPGGLWYERIKRIVTHDTHAMGTEMRETNHHSVSVGKRGLGSTDLCQLSVMETPPRQEGPQGSNFVHPYFGR